MADSDPGRCAHPQAVGQACALCLLDYDYVTEQPVRCMRVVMLVWTNGLLKIPVGFKLWPKEGSAYWQDREEPYQTKHDLARQC